MPKIDYDAVQLEDLLRIADTHTDPFVRALARRLDATHYQLNAYRSLLGLPPVSDTVRPNLSKE